MPKLKSIKAWCLKDKYSGFLAWAKPYYYKKYAIEEARLYPTYRVVRICITEVGPTPLKRKKKV